VITVQLLEHPGTAAEEHGDEVDRDLIDEPRLDELAPTLLIGNLLWLRSPFH
jgi:hypothetical protein